MSKRIFILLFSAIIILTLFSQTVFGQIFGGIPNHIERLTYIGVIVGDENGDLHLDKYLTRAEASVLIARLIGHGRNPDLIIPEEQIFADVSNEHWAFEYVQFLYSQDIIKGTSAGYFSPNDNLNYIQILALISRILAYDFGNRNLHGYPTDYLIFAATNGISVIEFDGFSFHNKSFELYEPIARKYVLELINRALEIDVRRWRRTSGSTRYLWDLMNFRRVEFVYSPTFFPVNFPDSETIEFTYRLAGEGRDVIATFEYSSENQTFTIRRYKNPNEPHIIEILAAELDYNFERYTEKPFISERRTWFGMSRTFWVDDSDVEYGGYPRIVFMRDNFFSR